MHHAAIVASLYLSLVATPAISESAAQVGDPVHKPAQDGLLQAPVSLENLRAEVTDGGLEIRFTLREVGPVSVAV